MKLSKGNIVRYKEGWMEVRAAYKNTVNLGPIFQGRTTVKKVPVSEVQEDQEAWYKSWTQSETYMSM